MGHPLVVMTRRTKGKRPIIPNSEVVYLQMNFVRVCIAQIAVTCAAKTGSTTDHVIIVT
jgi:hypothetical protein